MPNGWTSIPTIWSIRKKASGTCHWLSALVREPFGMPTGLWKSRSIIILFNTFLVRLFDKYHTFFKRLSAAKVHFFFDIRKILMAEKSFFIHFREQGRATAHDFVVAHFARNHYLCIVFPKRKPIKAYGEADR